MNNEQAVPELDIKLKGLTLESKSAARNSVIVKNNIPTVKLFRILTRFLLCIFPWFFHLLWCDMHTISKHFINLVFIYREDRQRLGIAISAYLVYLDICSSTTAGRNRHLNEDACVQSTIEKNWLDLDIFSMKRFLEDFVGSLKIPSHKRYLKYFAGLLSGKIRMNSSSILLKRVIIETPPMWFQYDKGLSVQSSEWITFIKIYEGLQCAYTSSEYMLKLIILLKDNWEKQL